MAHCNFKRKGLAKTKQHYIIERKRRHGKWRTVHTDLSGQEIARGHERQKRTERLLAASITNADARKDLYKMISHHHGNKELNPKGFWNENGENLTAQG